jgi:protein-S-isoprenylcysteine O-methyltransferase Ste14
LPPFATVVRTLVRNRSPMSLGLRTALAHLWFALNFFLAFPALVLYASGASLWPPGGAPSALAAALILLAHVGIFALLVDFVRFGRGTQAPLDPPRELVLRGFYRFVRNPMYLLYVVIVLSEALLYRSPALLAYALAFWLLTHAYVVLREEPELERRFGAGYTGYCRRVGRWLPRRGARKAARASRD